MMDYARWKWWICAENDGLLQCSTVKKPDKKKGMKLLDVRLFIKNHEFYKNNDGFMLTQYDNFTMKMAAFANKMMILYNK